MFDSISNRTKIGIITQGSLSKGIVMRLDPTVSIESLKAGKFVVVEGNQYDFFAMITDVALEAANKNILLNPPGIDENFLREVLQGYATFGTVEIKPMLMMPNKESQEFEEAVRVKTVPTHFSLVADATEDDVARIFGNESNNPEKYFNIGNPLDMNEIPVCLDIDKFVERSNAVFGKTGTGKTFLTRLLLCGIIRTGKAVNLIFDMHSEYGLSARQEGTGSNFVKGLRNLFPSKVAIFSLDPESTRKRSGHNPQEVYLYADQIEPSDILPLQDTLNLNQTATETTYLLQNKYKKFWLKRLLDAETSEETKAMAEECSANEGSLLALKRKLERLKGFGFFKTESVRNHRDVIEDLMENIERGKSIVLEFGKYDSVLAYLFVANVITRRLRSVYEKKTNHFLSTQNEADKPKQLMITIEEAHKFLKPGLAQETPFGIIAREMRKYFVSLLVVDQRPSAIDEEVLSQIGTKIVAQLSDEKDITATLVGASNASGLRQVLTSLDSKQQALALGHAVPMPIVIKTRTYDEQFYQDMNPQQEISLKQMEDELKDLF